MPSVSMGPRETRTDQAPNQSVVAVAAAASTQILAANPRRKSAVLLNINVEAPVGVAQGVAAVFATHFRLFPLSHVEIVSFTGAINGIGNGAAGANVQVVEYEQ